MYYWGASGSVGEAPDDSILAPLNSLIGVIDVSAGSGYSLMVLSDGTAQAAGYVEDITAYKGHLGLRGGSLATGYNPPQYIANVFDAPRDLVIDAPPFKKAFAGVAQFDDPTSIHSVMIDVAGNAWSFGRNNYGQLCLSDFQDRLIPQQIQTNGLRVVSAAVGSEHTLLLLEDGTIWGCGSNRQGQLGLGPDIEDLENPTRIGDYDNVQSVSAGLNFSLFKTPGALFVMGNNLYGQLCVDTGAADVVFPEIITDANQFKAEDVATFQAIRSASYINFFDGSVGACGSNQFGQLGDGTNENRFRTVIDPLPADSQGFPSPIVRVGAGPSAESVFFLNAEGNTYATGLNDRGQLGVGDTLDRNTLTLVEFPDNAPVPEHISAAGDHTLSR